MLFGFIDVFLIAKAPILFFWLGICVGARLLAEEFPDLVIRTDVVMQRFLVAWVGVAISCNRILYSE